MKWKRQRFTIYELRFLQYRFVMFESIIFRIYSILEIALNILERQISLSTLFSFIPLPFLVIHIFHLFSLQPTVTVASRTKPTAVKSLCVIRVRRVRATRGRGAGGYVSMGNLEGRGISTRSLIVPSFV